MEKEKAIKIKEFLNDEIGIQKVVISNGRYYPKNIPEFVMLFQAITEQFINNLTPASAKILLYMLGKLRYSNHIGVNQETISEDCRLTKPTVIRAIKELISNDIVLSYKDSADHRRNVYIINPYNAWKGTFKERTKALRNIDNQLKLFPSEKTKILLSGSSEENKSSGGLGEESPQ